MDRYCIDHEIAATRDSQVLLCADTVTGRPVVVKRMRVHHVVAAAATAVSTELHVHRDLSQDGGHPNVLQLLDAFTMDGHEHIVMEYCAQGELFDLVENAPDRRLDPALVCTIFAIICDAVHYIHTRGFAHCDLSLENVLVDGLGQLKLSDFGLATPLHEASHQHALVGKDFYMAPEKYMMDAHDPAKADVWSLGVMLFILVTGYPPFESARASDSSMQLVATKGLRSLCQAWQLDSVIPAHAMTLLEKMLEVNPAERWSLDQVMAHEYVVGQSKDQHSMPLVNATAKKPFVLLQGAAAAH
ncbi:Aste57867_25045 [Aphanomyces stellatus]|uniref:Aste57867_25045 protein n=1 Tax=Aphanomyces stellatus TaxID=120398 RepID=A0A485LS34_9STRA|nr:hypothetical protein As57867_024967 [Aphanomyces stellatus]VFU01676.1 Aste57867_25045 [Aphanomyces stellatus]